MSFVLLLRMTLWIASDDWSLLTTYKAEPCSEGLDVFGSLGEGWELLPGPGRGEGGSLQSLSSEDGASARVVHLMFPTLTVALENYWLFWISRLFWHCSWPQYYMQFSTISIALEILVLSIAAGWVGLVVFLVCQWLTFPVPWSLKLGGQEKSCVEKKKKKIGSYMYASYFIWVCCFLIWKSLFLLSAQLTES